MAHILKPNRLLLLSVIVDRVREISITKEQSVPTKITFVATHLLGPDSASQSVSEVRKLHIIHST